MTFWRSFWRTLFWMLAIGYTAILMFWLGIQIGKLFGPAFTEAEPLITKIRMR